MPTLNSRQSRDMAKVEDAIRGAHPADKWFYPIQRLLIAYPTWGWAKFRFAYAVLYLEDLETALQHFQEARALVTGVDGLFDAWFTSFKAQVEVRYELRSQLSQGIHFVIAGVQQGRWVT